MSVDVRPMRAVLVGGTWSYKGTGAADWWAPTSPFAQALEASGVALASPQSPFEWDTDLGGWNPFSDADLRGWQASGTALHHYCTPPLCHGKHGLPPDQLVIISHSHGLQPALFAAARGLRFVLVDVCGPVRHDMMPVAKRALEHLRWWTHLSGGGRDRWQWLGAVGDRHVGIERSHPLAHRNVAVPAVDHGELLRDPVYFPIVLEAVHSAIAAARAKEAQS